MNVILVGQVTEVFSSFTVTECMALLTKPYQYIKNTPCSSLTTVLLPDFCTGMTKDDWTHSSEVNPIINFTDSRSRNIRKFPQEGKFTLWCFNFLLTVFWSRLHQGTPHLLHEKYSSLRNQETKVLLLSFTKNIILPCCCHTFSGVQNICLIRSSIISPD